MTKNAIKCLCLGICPTCYFQSQYNLTAQVRRFTGLPLVVPHYFSGRPDNLDKCFNKSGFLFESLTIKALQFREDKMDACCSFCLILSSEAISGAEQDSGLF